jgi:predicted TIM-barrel fold metal-dependent hydrolase
MKFFDAHIHIQPWVLLRENAYKVLCKGRTDTDIEYTKKIMEDPEEMIAFFDRENISRACIINYVSHKIMGFTEEVNDYAVKLYKLFPDRIIPFGGVDPLFTKDVESELKRIIDRGIRGFKLHPSHQLIRPNAYIDNVKSLEIIYTILQERKIPLMIHTGTSIFPGARNLYSYPMYAEDIGIDFPELVVILSHGGRPLWMNETFFLIRRFKNFYLDISGIPPLKVLEYFPKLEEIKDKVLFGSDWPAPGVKSPSINAKMFAKLPLPPQTISAILYTNAEKLFNLKP